MSEELRIKIAKMLGWRHQEELPIGYSPCSLGDKGWWITPDGKEAVCGYCQFDTTIPDYPNSIEAAYELEGTIPVELHDDYVERLVNSLTNGEPWKRDGFDVSWLLVHATPEQRCLAYVQTMEAK